MQAIFPSAEWLNTLEDKLNNDQRYNQIASKWEGELFFIIEPEFSLTEELRFYLDLWHGTCRKVDYQPPQEAYPKAAYRLTATYGHIRDILTGKLHPMTAMLTNKLRLKGSMAYMMRNVPTVLDFVRCAQEVTSEVQ